MLYVPPVCAAAGTVNTRRPLSSDHVAPVPSPKTFQSFVFGVVSEKSSLSVTACAGGGVVVTGGFTLGFGFGFGATGVVWAGAAVTAGTVTVRDAAGVVWTWTTMCLARTVGLTCATVCFVRAGCARCFFAGTTAAGRRA